MLSTTGRCVAVGDGVAVSEMQPARGQGVLVLAIFRQTHGGSDAVFCGQLGSKVGESLAVEEDEGGAPKAGCDNGGGVAAMQPVIERTMAALNATDLVRLMRIVPPTFQGYGRLTDSS